MVFMQMINWLEQVHSQMRRNTSKKKSCQVLISIISKSSVITIPPDV